MIKYAFLNGRPMKLDVPIMGKCTCDVCETGRKYERIISKLPEKERKWMSNFYNAAFEESAELDMYRAVYEKPHGHKLKP